MMCWRASAAHHTRSSPDYTYNFPVTVIISFFELWLGVMTACIPTLAPLFRAYIEPVIHKMRSSLASSGGIKDAALTNINDENNVEGRYIELEEVDNVSNGDHGHRKIPTSRAGTTTRCIYEPSNQEIVTSTNREEIRVQQGFGCNSV